MSIRKEFMIERQGKTYVLYSGLLEEAHSQGLKSIRVELLEKPNQVNDMVAIAKATVEMEDGRIFEDVGDASPSNVGKNIAPHIVRMASTRAKARALRDAVNIGVTAFEEIGGSEAEESGTPTERTSSSNVTEMRKAQERASQAAQAQKSEDPGGLPATRKQLNYLETLLKDSDDVRVRLEQKYGKPVSEMTRHEASEAIGVLSERKSE